MHKFMKAAKVKSEADFYRKYPTEKAFFADYPHMQDGVLPQVMPGTYPGNPPVVMNQQAKMPVEVDVPAYAQGGFYQRPGYYYNGTAMEKAKGSGTYDTSGYYFQQGGYPHPLNTPFDNFERGGYPHPLDMPFDEFKKGGIHIKPENKGKFNALKKRTGKTTEELTHSKNPLTRKRAIFAQNAAKWKKEDGGYVENEYTNPFHPMHMATGGYVNPWAPQNPNTDETMQDVNTGYQQAQSDEALANDPIAQQQMKPNSGAAPVSSQYATNDQPVDVAPQSQMYSTEEPQEEQGQPQGPRNNGVANWGSAILGVGTGILGTASILNNKFNNQKVQQRWQRDQGMSDRLPRYINSYGKGTTDQFGNIPYNNMSNSPNIRTMERGGYTKGQEVELTEQEIAALIRKGYKLQRI